MSALGQREAIAFGDGVALPVRIRFDELPKSCMPRSSTARFSEKWQHSTEDEGFLDAVVERWRSAGMGSLSEHSQHAGAAHETHQQHAAPAEPAKPEYAPAYASRGSIQAPDPLRTSGFLRRDQADAGHSPASSSLRRELPAPAAPATSLQQQPSAARQSLRDRLMKPQAGR